MSIKEKYDKLKFDEELFYQVKNKKNFDKVINEMKKVFDDWDFMFIKDDLNYKNTYFIIGHWRDGMFELRNGVIKDYKETNYIHILADYKESPIEEVKHLNQIEYLINVMEKYKDCFVNKKMCFDKNFNIIKK